ncbi:MAG TPA: hypothetical protein VE733_05925 [Streptosporangiaceae bacterium]|nr:hypothetical protein [Streptosporangiaceae bacterium]
MIEDAHWADRSSRDLLAFLVRYQRSLRGALRSSSRSGPTNCTVATRCARAFAALAASAVFAVIAFGFVFTLPRQLVR